MRPLKPSSAVAVKPPPFYEDVMEGLSLLFDIEEPIRFIRSEQVPDALLKAIGEVLIEQKSGRLDRETSEATLRLLVSLYASHSIFNALYEAIGALYERK